MTVPKFLDMTHVLSSKIHLLSAQAFFPLSPCLKNPPRTAVLSQPQHIHQRRVRVLPSYAGEKHLWEARSMTQDRVLDESSPGTEGTIPHCATAK